MNESSRRNINCIVVGIDGSSEARQALSWAGQLAQRIGAELLVVHAVGLLERLDTVEKGTSQSDLRKSIVVDCCDPLRGYSISWRLEVLDGEPVDLLLRVADAEGADLIVVGTRGSGRRPPGLIGSTSHELALKAHIPVTLVPMEASVTKK